MHVSQEYLLQYCTDLRSPSSVVPTPYKGTAPVVLLARYHSMPIYTTTRSTRTNAQLLNCWDAAGDDQSMQERLDRDGMRWDGKGLRSSRRIGHR